MGWRPQCEHKMVQGAHSPWKTADGADRRKLEPPKNYSNVPQAEIDTCLNCQAPECRQKYCNLNPVCGPKRKSVRMGRKERPIPEDFAETGRVMTNNQLCKFYHASHYTICKWRNITGIRREV